MNKYQSIETIAYCGQTDLQTTLQDRTQPLVIKGLVAHWPLTKLANNLELALQHLQQSASEQYVYVNQAAHESQGRFFYTDDFSDKNFTQSPQLLKTFLASLAQRTNSSGTESDFQYMASTSVDYCFPNLLLEHTLPVALPSPLVSAWLGTQSVAATHFDVPQNIACNVLGQRRFTLFPPEQHDNLYIGPLDFTPAGQPVSLVDVKAPNLMKHPKFSTAIAHGYQVTLAPGDALFIPSMWWHNVEALDNVNLLFNYWWHSNPTYLGAPMDALKHAILSIKSLPIEQRQAWKQLFSSYVFDHQPDQFEHIPQNALGMLDDLIESNTNQYQTLSEAEATTPEMRARQIRASLLKALNK